MQEWKKNTIILGQTNKKTPEIMYTRNHPPLQIPRIYAL